MTDTMDAETGWIRRVRSTVLLLLMVAGLGAAAAGIIGVVVVVGSSLFDQALG